MRRPLVLIGPGFTGQEILAQRAPASDTVVASRRPQPALAERFSRVTWWVAPSLSPETLRAHLGDGGDLIVTAPPDGLTDARLSAAIGPRDRVVYIATTGLYGARAGHIDHTTPIAPDSDKARLRAEAEAAWCDKGAVSLRAAGIYGTGRGLHLRIARGDFALPDDPEKVVSRVHVADLAQLCLASLEVPSLRGRGWPVADLCAVPQAQVVRALCRALGRPLPPRVAVGDAPESLRHHRAVDSRALLAATDVTLRYPGWVEGFTACIAGDRLAVEMPLAEAARESAVRASPR
ncbi:MAG: hypothetical protein JNK72_22995 [Myxococcales bacterium]|nr:hypothetical protein [Myxococcales bacterium]